MTTLHQCPSCTNWYPTPGICETCQGEAARIAAEQGLAPNPMNLADLARAYKEILQDVDARSTRTRFPWGAVVEVPAQDQQGASAKPDRWLNIRHRDGARLFGVPESDIPPGTLEEWKRLGVVVEEVETELLPNGLRLPTARASDPNQTVTTSSAYAESFREPEGLIQYQSASDIVDILGKPTVETHPAPNYRTHVHWEYDLIPALDYSGVAALPPAPDAAPDNWGVSVVELQREAIRKHLSEVTREALMYGRPLLPGEEVVSAPVWTERVIATGPCVLAEIRCVRAGDLDIWDQSPEQPARDHALCDPPQLRVSLENLAAGLLITFNPPLTFVRGLVLEYPETAEFKAKVTT